MVSYKRALTVLTGRKTTFENTHLYRVSGTLRVIEWGGGWEGRGKSGGKGRGKSGGKGRGKSGGKGRVRGGRVSGRIGESFGLSSISIFISQLNRPNRSTDIVFYTFGKNPCPYLMFSEALQDYISSQVFTGSVSCTEYYTV